MTLAAPYRLVDDRAQIDVDAVHSFLTRSYWAKGISRETVARSIAGSHCVATLKADQFVGFARVITDYATFAYLADVFVIPTERGHGLASAMISYFQTHRRLRSLRHWVLFTRDAHALYARHGWHKSDNPERLMHRLDLSEYGTP